MLLLLKKKNNIKLFILQNIWKELLYFIITELTHVLSKKFIELQVINTCYQWWGKTRYDNGSQKRTWHNSRKFMMIVLLKRKIWC